MIKNKFIVLLSIHIEIILLSQEVKIKVLKYGILEILIQDYINLMIIKIVYLL
jgi:hypothetical protein